MYFAILGKSGFLASASDLWLSPNIEIVSPLFPMYCNIPRFLKTCLIYLPGCVNIGITIYSDSALDSVTEFWFVLAREIAPP
jgi:hypothetical protein